MIAKKVGYCDEADIRRQRMGQEGRCSGVIFELPDKCRFHIYMTYSFVRVEEPTSKGRKARKGYM